MVETKVKQLHTNVNGEGKKNSSKEELVKRVSIDESPFEVITIKGESFGAMGDYRLTEKYKTATEVKKELKKITWNRIIQVIMILDEVKQKLNQKK
jgi:translation elongation factor P/translation initiation factor 5A